MTGSSISIVCFTKKGSDTAMKIKKCLGGSTQIYCKKKDRIHNEQVQDFSVSLREWTQHAFQNSAALIFVGATGIAVRSIAPFLKSKTSDPAVITVDESGKFVISLVSGHLGGANALCGKIAETLGAVPVITTATDLQHKFAVDVFAKENHLWISDMKTAKWISAAVLDGEQIKFESDFPIEGNIPLELQPKPAAKCRYGIKISIGDVTDADDSVLRLVPRIAVLGIGCRKGKSLKDLETFITGFLKEHQISYESLHKISSIDVKAKEEGILKFCEKYKIPFETYSAEELKNVTGKFTGSSFVSGQVGVDNVCERSAVLGSQGGSLLIKKTACNGMTAALALKEWRVRFE